MDELWRFGSEGSNENAKVRVGVAATRQYGRVSVSQLHQLGVAKATVAAWVETGYLYHVHPGVLAVGHAGSSTEADLAAALLYAGPGAMLSHGTAVWWWGLVEHKPDVIEVSTPRRRLSVSGVDVHGRRRNLERVWRARLTVTTVAQALLDFASQATEDRLRHALAQADYRCLIQLAAVEAVLKRGCPGSAVLRKALADYDPRYAYTRSRLERAFLALCKRYRIPLPRVNVKVEDWLVDAVWAEHKVIVELDGYRNHRSRAQLDRDHQRDLALRAAGYTVVRYTERQVIEQADAVADDLSVLLSLAAPLAGPGSR